MYVCKYQDAYEPETECIVCLPIHVLVIRLKAEQFGRVCIWRMDDGGKAACSQLEEDGGRRMRYKRIDEEQAQGFLGRGGFGEIYIAEDTCTGDVVAVKRQAYPSTEAAKELAFAKVLASSPSAHVVRMIDYFCDVGVGSASRQRCLYLVFEYMDTTVWQEFVRRKGLFDRQLCVRIFTDICRGTQHMPGHSSHRLGLPNLLHSHGRAKVADLGCSYCASTWVLPSARRGQPTAGHQSCGWLVAKKVRLAASPQPFAAQRLLPLRQTCGASEFAWACC